MSLADAAPIEERSGVTPEAFMQDIYPAAKPVVMRGFVEGWKSVALARQSDDALIDYFKRGALQTPVDVLRAGPGIGGRFFYNESFTGLNFTRSQMGYGAALDEVRGAEADAVNIQSTLIDTVMPDFSSENAVSFLPPSIRPRIWIGNKVKVQTHYDLSQNIACVVAGRRRFTLFPPEQLANLYMGPIEQSLAGTPVSLVDPDNVDETRFPRFKDAAAHAQTAELGPGDAIFIPYFWWHGVESLSAFNVLVNYWWNEHDVLGSPMDAMLHAVLTIKDLPPAMKRPWKAMFDQFVFAEDEEGVRHIPEHARGGLGRMTSQTRGGLWQALAGNLNAYLQRIRGR